MKYIRENTITENILRIVKFEISLANIKDAEHDNIGFHMSTIRVN